MGETLRSYSFTYGDGLRVQYETELGAVQVALMESGGRVEKTFPQLSPVAPYQRGDVFTLGAELNSNKFPGAADFANCQVVVDECTVSDKPIVTSGKVRRIWLVSVSGRIKKSGALEGYESDADYTMSYSQSTKKTDGKTVKSGGITLWSLNAASPYAVGDTFAPVPGADEINVTEVSISDQVIGRMPNGSLKRLWKITVSGDDSSIVGTNVKYTFSREEDERGFSIIRGTMTKTAEGTTAPVMPAVGDSFAVPYIGSVVCVKVSGDKSGDNWNMTADGAAVVLPAEYVPEGESDTEYTPNGVVTRDVVGQMAVLLRSSSPITKKRTVVYTTTAAPVATQGALYNGLICTSENITREKININGITVATFYRHDIGSEY